MNEEPGHVPPIESGEIMRAGSICRVIESRIDGIPPGDLAPAGRTTPHFLLTPSGGSTTRSAPSTDQTLAIDEDGVALGRTPFAPLERGTFSSLAPVTHP
jgi:hypothetical protein